MNEFQFIRWCHLLMVLKNNKISMPTELPECLNVIVLQRIMENVSLNYKSLNYAILNKNKEEIEKIVKENKDSINIRDKYGNTPIEIAISLSDLSIVQCLINNGTNIDYKSLLFYALKQKQNEMAIVLFNKITDFKECMFFFMAQYVNCVYMCVCVHFFFAKKIK